MTGVADPADRVSDALPYRRHHFLCSLGFEGKGYSDAFTANMAAIVQGRLRAPGGAATLIGVTATADAICAPCPKRQDSGCIEQARIDALDAAHGAALGIAPRRPTELGRRAGADPRPGHARRSGAALCRLPLACRGDVRGGIGAPARQPRRVRETDVWHWGGVQSNSTLIQSDLTNSHCPPNNQGIARQYRSVWLS